LEGNPGITGEIFSDDASYIANAKKYGQSSEEVEKLTNKVVFKDHKQWAAENLKGETVTPKDFCRAIEFSNNGIKEYLNQPHENYYAKNEMIRNMPEILENATYMGVTEYKGRTSHIFEVTVNGKINYLIVNEQDDGRIYFHSITSGNSVLIGIKK